MPKGYLALSRRVDQGVTLRDNETGEEIHFIITKTNPMTTRLAIKAPSKYQILRDELLYRSVGTPHARNQNTSEEEDTDLSPSSPHETHRTIG